MIEDAASIESLRTKLHEANSRVEKIRCHMVKDYLKSLESDEKKIRIFKYGSKSYHARCWEAGLDLFVIAA